MSKREMIHRIMELNRTARPEFLEEFSENELGDYLRQLENLDQRIRHVRDRAVTPRAR